jgi:hypothetical protein
MPSKKNTNTAKYAQRPSPPVSAQDYKNKIKLGNDGNKYISSPDANGIYKWKKYASKTSNKTAIQKTGSKKTSVSSSVHKYYPHDNNARHILVEDYPALSKVIVYAKTQKDSKTYDKKLLETKYSDIYFGKPTNQLLKDPRYSYEKGNSILVKVMQGKYLFLGDEIFLFATKNKEEIVQFVSPTGNSDVVYPFAIGDKYTYILLDKVYIANDTLDPANPHIYDQYYKADSLRQQLSQIRKSAKNKTDEGAKTKAQQDLVHALNIEKSIKKMQTKQLFTRNLLAKD